MYWDEPPFSPESGGVDLDYRAKLTANSGAFSDVDINHPD